MVRERIRQWPNVPTMAESDPRLKDYDVYTWAMLVAPKATPDRAVQRLHEVAIAAARQPDVMKRFEEMGFDYVGSSPADGDKRLEVERDKWRDVIKRANIKVDL
jgi:tripartite-type tricarboxylate transporter receptor subunit TctC